MIDAAFSIKTGQNRDSYPTAMPLESHSNRNFVVSHDIRLLLRSNMADTGVPCSDETESI